MMRTALILSALLSVSPLNYWQHITVPRGESWSWGSHIPEELSGIQMRALWGCTVRCSTYSCMIDKCPSWDH